MGVNPPKQGLGYHSRVPGVKSPRIEGQNCDFLFSSKSGLCCSASALRLLSRW